VQPPKITLRTPGIDLRVVFIAGEEGVRDLLDVDREHVELIAPGRQPISCSVTWQCRSRRAGSVTCSAVPYTLKSPSVPSLSEVVLCTVHRGSRSRSSAFSDCHIMPSCNSPSTSLGSTGVMRGQPFARSVPTSTSPVARKRASPSAASSGAFASNSAHVVMPRTVRPGSDTSRLSEEEWDILDALHRRET
jgi:hypothetical protein